MGLEFERLFNFLNSESFRRALELLDRTLISLPLGIAPMTAVKPWPEDDF
jgi:hypothetical protein